MIKSNIMKKHYKPTKDGYVRRRYGGNMRFEHVIVWETAFGKKPEGYIIHHIDGDKLNNGISNLMLVTPTEHKRIHSGCVKRAGEWLKPCKVCGEYKPCDEEHWHYRDGWIRGRVCKNCSNRIRNERRRTQKQAENERQVQ